LKVLLVAEAEEANSAMRARGTRLPDWLARSGQQTPGHVKSVVWAGRLFERRPRVRDAAVSGRIGLDQAKAIGEALDGLPSGFDAGQRRVAEDLILRAAEHTPAEKLRAMAPRLVEQVSPEARETAQERVGRLEARDVRARQRRCLRFGPELDGSIEVSGSVPVVDGRRLQQLVQAVADRSYRAAKDTHDRRALADTPQQRMCDALLVVADAAQARENGARGNGLPVNGSAAQLSVIIPYEQLLDRATTRGLLPDGTAISAGELRRLACSADLVPVVLDSQGVVLDLGRRIRLAPEHLRLAIGLRDGGCAFPGCTAPIFHCDLHHITPWQDDGPTQPDNLVALCRVHHSLIEPIPAQRRDDGTLEIADQWQVRIDTRGLPEFVPPAALDCARTPIRKDAGHAATLLLDDTG
jgi:hypothetical protein